jgi:hypothetical protein
MGSFNGRRTDDPRVFFMDLEEWGFLGVNEEEWDGMRVIDSRCRDWHPRDRDDLPGNCLGFQ